MILIVDNYDSFTFNLMQYIGEMDPDIRVIRNDQMSVPEALALKPSHIVISPGPCTPAEAGISIDLILACPPSTPLLGVCLGHQSIGAAFGGKVVRAPAPMHGKTSVIRSDGKGVFRGLGEFTATRYHSLIVAAEGLPPALAVTATCRSKPDEGMIMGLRHRERPVFGVQFHPESILTEHGKAMIRNFLDMKGA